MQCFHSVHCTTVQCVPSFHDRNGIPHSSINVVMYKLLDATLTVKP